jgi:hypothetical protein
MTNSANQVFTNTCGKIYRDQLILATHQKDTPLTYQEIKSIAFNKRRKRSDLLFAILPCLLIVVAFFLKKEDTFLKAIFIFLGVAGVFLTLFKGQTRYVVTVKTIDGKTIFVRAANKREAEKFSSQANSVLHKHKV